MWWTLASEVWGLVILKIFINETFVLERFVHIVLLWCSHGPHKAKYSDCLHWSGLEIPWGHHGI